MDNNKSRTDLLAAGRKKLQQFRQKKDSSSKGSGSGHGKSKKSAKLDSDSNDSSVSGKPTGLPEVLEGETLSHVDSRLGDVDSSSVSGSVVNRVDPDSDIVAVEIPVSTETSLTGDPRENPELHAAEVGRGKGVGSSDIDQQEKSVYTPEDEGNRAAPLDHSDIPRSEDASTSDHTSATVDGVVLSSTSDDPDGTNVTVEAESINMEEQQHLLIADKGNQVSDEADGVGNQFSRSSEIGLDRDRSQFSSEHHAIGGTQQNATFEQTGVQGAASALMQATGRKDEESVTGGLPKVPDGSTESTLAVSESDVTLDVIRSPLNFEILDGLSMSGDYGNDREDSAQGGSLVSETYNQQCKPEDSFIFVEKSHERPLSPELGSLSEGYNTLPLGFQYPCGFPQLVELVKGLSEDEFKLLLKLRGLDSDSPMEPGSLTSQHNGLASSWERLKEELFLSSFVNDIFHVQLIEQSKIQREQDCHISRLDDEVSTLHASLEEANQRNECLTEDLSCCKSDLQATISEKEELQHKLHAANTEIDDLQNNLERRHSDIFSLTKELADCKNLLAALQSETKNLNGTLSSVTEERNKLVEEKDFFLRDNEKLSKQLADCKDLVASLRVEHSDLSENLERCHSDVFSLSKELADCKNLKAALQSETENLNGSLSSITEERNKLVEEKDFFLHDNDNLSKQLVDCRDLVASLQVERSDLSENLERCHSDVFSLSNELADCKNLKAALQSKTENLNESLSSVTEERNKLVEEKDFFLRDNEKLSKQLADCKDLVASLRVEHSDLSENLERCHSDVFSLSKELADCKNLKAALQSETENLNGSLSSITEERNKLVEEKDFFLHDNDNLSKQLVDCRDLVASLQVERSDLSENLERCHSDVFSLSNELADCKNLKAALQSKTENLNESLSSVTEERNKLVKENEFFLHDNDKLSKQLADCKDLVASLQVECSNLSGTLAFVTEERNKSEGEKQHLANAYGELSLELSSQKDLIEALRLENANLNGNLALLREEKEKFDEQKLTLVQENERLSSELLVLGERLAKDREERACFEDKFEEMTIHLEQLREENSSLVSSLEMHKAMVREFDERQAQFSAMVGAIDQVGNIEVQGRGYDSATNDDRSSASHGNHVDEAMLSVLEKPKSEGDAGVPSHKLIDESDDYSVFLVLKGHVEEADRTLQKLEKALEGLHSHSTSLSRSGGKGGSPAVSKLIQAFESKVHHDEQVDEPATPQDQMAALDLFASTNELVGSLRAVLKQLALDAENSNSLFEREWVARHTADLSLRKVKVQVEALEEHSVDVEAVSIELLVLFEAIKHSAYSLKEQNSELQVLGNFWQQQNNSLKAESWELGEQQNLCELKVQELQMQLHEMQQISNDMVAELREQLENFQKEAADKTLKDEQEWRDTVSQILEEFQRLEDCCGLLHPFAIPTGSYSTFDIIGLTSMSVTAAVEMIKDLQIKLKAARTDEEASFNLFNEANKKCIELLAKNDLAAETLQKLHSELRQLVSDANGYVDLTEVSIEGEMLPTPVDYDSCMALVDQLKKFLADRLQLQSGNSKLSSELMSRTKDIEELNRRCLESSSIQKLAEDIEGVLKLEGARMDLDESPVSRLVSLVSFLVCKYREVDEQVSSLKKEFGYEVVESTELRAKIQQLQALNLQHENDIVILKQQSSQVEEAQVVARSELQEKANELVQSEQRVSSIREKLSIAVAKGKALVGQRDSLKQSLAETSSELERLKQELQVKDARIHEVEATLKNCSEAGERVEALESELSYIRNSATALRESFLLKDSVLQRIEEILEDLELPEDFHSKDIIDKVDWLVRSASGNSLPSADWDQKSSVGGSHSDASYVFMDTWKGEVQSSTNFGDDLRRKYEDLQNKFYGLAEQNDMIEQSLMERNHLMQRWEEILDRINMPAHLRVLEPEVRIEWLGSALSEANNDRNALLQKIDNFETRCTMLRSDLEESQLKISLLNAELEESQRIKSDLEMELKDVDNEREVLSEKLEILSSDHEKLSGMVGQYELDIKKLQNEVAGLEEELAEKTASVEQVHNIDIRIRRLNDLVSSALYEPDAQELPSGSSTDCLEVLLKKLIEDYAVQSSKKRVLGGDTVQEHEEHSTEKPLVDPVKGSSSRSTLELKESDVGVLKRETTVAEEPNVDILKKHLDEILGQLRDVTEERDRYVELHQSLLGEVEMLNQKKLELQEVLNLEEQKSTSLRDKLNVAVKKGKSVVQQRDSLKQAVEELNAAQEHLKSEIKQQENALAEYEIKMKELSIYPEKVGVLESENLSLRNHLAETEWTLQEKVHSLTLILGTLGDIDVGGEFSGSDPCVKLEHIGKLCCDLRASMASMEQDSRKSRRAAELLLAELNEVQDRNDHLQEELAKATDELAELSERNVALAAKVEALPRLEELSRFHSAEAKKVNSELLVVKFAADQLRQGIFDINNLLAGAFSKDLEFLHNLETAMESCVRGLEPNHVVQMPFFNTLSNSGKEDIFRPVDFSLETDAPDHLDGDFINDIGSFLQELMKEIGVLKGMLKQHSVSLHQQANNLSELMGICHREMISQKESLEAIKKDLKHVESVEEEREREVVLLRKNLFLLYEACRKSLLEFGNIKAEVAQKSMDFSDMGPLTFSDGGRLSSWEKVHSSEEQIKSMVERMSLTVKSFTSLINENLQEETREMKIIIANLQKELQEKDFQKEKICSELVNQIKEAEAAARGYLLDLQSSKNLVRDLEKQVAMMEEERNLLDQRVKELQLGQTISAELQERIKSLTDVVASKDNEIEALMQALDEEEVQMEDVRTKIEELEKVLQQKSLDVENLEASRAKVLKKLANTKRKFDELHQLSTTLLAEGEKLQLQVRDRDAEISFLRQEVGRCTKEVLTTSQMSSKTSSDGIHEILMWLDSQLSQVAMQDMELDYGTGSEAPEFKEMLQKKIAFILSQLEDLRVMAQSKDALLQMERGKIEELTRREEILEKALREKESHLNMLEEVGDSARPTSLASEISEVAPVTNKWTVPGPAAVSQVRSLRKVNTDQVSIAIDENDVGSNRLEDEDDDKVHGFKALTTSRIVPKFTRPISDMVDGLWVSCDRALMRQPALRLGIMIYWALLHALLAIFVF